MDIFTKKQRSRIMASVRSCGNKSTELRLIELFKQSHITGWRRKQRVYGNPDFVFRQRRLAVFVDGCFWHGCKHCQKKPSSNKVFWDAKIRHNRDRDRTVTRILQQKGWFVSRIWEHELRANTRKAFKKISASLSNGTMRHNNP